MLQSLAPGLSEVERAAVAGLVAAGQAGARAAEGPPSGLLGRDDDLGMNRRATELLASGAATIVVFGHTHVLVDGLMPFGVADPRRIFNTGSWMPRVAVEGLERPTFADVAGLGVTGHELRFLAVEVDDPPRARLERVGVDLEEARSLGRRRRRGRPDRRRSWPGHHVRGQSPVDRRGTTAYSACAARDRPSTGMSKR